ENEEVRLKKVLKKSRYGLLRRLLQGKTRILKRILFFEERKRKFFALFQGEFRMFVNEILWHNREKMTGDVPSYGIRAQWAYNAMTEKEMKGKFIEAIERMYAIERKRTLSELEKRAQLNKVESLYNNASLSGKSALFKITELAIKTGARRLTTADDLIRSLNLMLASASLKEKPEWISEGLDLVLFLAEKGIDPTDIITTGIPKAALALSYRPDWFYDAMKYARDIANKNISPEIFLEIEIPAVMKVCNTREDFQVLLPELEKFAESVHGTKVAEYGVDSAIRVSANIRQLINMLSEIERVCDMVNKYTPEGDVLLEPIIPSIARICKRPQEFKKAFVMLEKLIGEPGRPHVDTLLIHGVPAVLRRSQNITDIAKGFKDLRKLDDVMLIYGVPEAERVFQTPRLFRNALAELAAGDHVIDLTAMADTGLSGDDIRKVMDAKRRDQEIKDPSKRTHVRDALLAVTRDIRGDIRDLLEGKYEDQKKLEDSVASIQGVLARQIYFLITESLVGEKNIPGELLSDKNRAKSVVEKDMICNGYGNNVKIGEKKICKGGYVSLKCYKDWSIASLVLVRSMDSEKVKYRGLFGKVKKTINGLVSSFSRSGRSL
ncbi:hypothetical protein ACFLQ8_01455, partial [Candidatus Auribacterota bacterium]